MKVFFHDDFYQVYTSDPAAEAGRMEAIVNVISSEVEFHTIVPCTEDDILLVHAKNHLDHVREEGLYSIASLAAGGAIQAAITGLTEPSFGLIRPPGHHASSGAAWGFCYFNNMAIAVEVLKQRGKINTAYILDIDMHFGDGTENILKSNDYVVVHNIHTEDREEYMEEIRQSMASCHVDIIGISAGFDNHKEDWGGVLTTEDYTEIGQLVRESAKRSGGGYFALLEGGYNHDVLGHNALALIRGMKG